MVTEVATIPGYITPGVAARQLGITEGTLRYHQRRGRLPIVLIGGVPFYRVQDVQTFARRRAARREEASHVALSEET